MPALNAAQHPGGCLSESLMQAELQRHTHNVPRSLGKAAEIVAPSDFEFGWICYVISLSSFCPMPEELDLVN